MIHSHHTGLKFVRNYLDLANRLEEAIAGLIMVLGFTLIAGFTAASEKQGVRTLLLGALGCNTAWGIIDGALLAWGNLTDRRLQLRFLTNLRSAPNESEVFSAIGGRLNPLLEPGVGAEERTSLCKAILPVMMRVQLPDPNLTKDDVNGMIAIFMIDVAAVIPAVIPFLFCRRLRKYMVDEFCELLTSAAQMYADSCCETLALAVLGGPGRGSQVG